MQDRANEILRGGLADVRRVPLARAPRRRRRPSTYDYLGTYVDDLPAVLDLDAVREAGVRIGADPLGGASVDYWGAIAERHRLDLTVVNPRGRPDLAVHDAGLGRQDPDGLLVAVRDGLAGRADRGRRARYDIATGNDADSDRHGIVTPDAGLMNPNHFLAVAIEYLYSHRDGWSRDAAIGKTLVSSSMIDRVAESLGRRLVEVPVGFKWFVPGPARRLGRASAARSRRARRSCAGTAAVWTTDKDGILLCAARLGDPGGHRARRRASGTASLVERFGDPAYARVDAPASREEKEVLGSLSADQVTATELAGEPITGKLTEAPGNGAKIGGLKVTTESAWFAARPSGTEDVYKIYAESFRGRRPPRAGAGRRRARSCRRRSPA